MSAHAGSCLRHTAPPNRHRGGVLISTPQGGGPAVARDTVACCHCGRHWVWEPGSGRVRGWCLRCAGLTCGSPRCCACVPVEQWLENVEAGRAADFRPILGRVEAEPPRG